MICIGIVKSLGSALSEMFQQGLWVNPERPRNCFETVWMLKECSLSRESAIAAT